MANTLMTPPELDSKEKSTEHGAGYEPHLGVDPELEGESVFGSLWSSIRDVFFPEKLPPLVLESKPIAVADPMAVKRDPVSTGVAVVVHVVIILLIFYFVGRKIMAPEIKKPLVSNVDLNAPVPPAAKLAAKPMGGGGGQHDIAPVSKGRIPPIAKETLVPPTKPPVIPAKLEVQPTINLQKDLKMANNNMPNFGDPHAPAVGVQSGGNGSGNGLGSGNGNGLGPGSGGNTGGGVFQIGNGVSAPRLVYQPDPEFSEEARKAKFQGSVLVNLIVDATGRPVRVRVLRPVGMGLDEKAMEAVRLYKFIPAKKGDQPVAVELNVEVNFQIF